MTRKNKRASEHIPNGAYWPAGLSDAEYCKYDGEPWPCPTVSARNHQGASSMTTFQINDRVRVIASPCKWHDLVGTIHDEAGGLFHVRGLDAAPVWFYPHELVHVAPVGETFADKMAQRSLDAVQHESWRAKQ